MAVARKYKQTYIKQEIITKLIFLMNSYVTKHTDGKYLVRVYDIIYHNSEKRVGKKLHNVLEPTNGALEEHSPHYRRLLKLLDGWTYPQTIDGDSEFGKRTLTMVTQDDFNFLNSLHRILLLEIRSGKYEMIL